MHCRQRRIEPRSHVSNLSRKLREVWTVVFWRRFVKRFALCYRTVVMTVCLSVCLSVLSCPLLLSCLSVTLVYCGQTAGWIKMPFGMEAQVTLCYMGTEPPICPQFSAHVCCGQTAGWIKMPFGIEVGLSLSDIVLDEDPAPLPQRTQPPIFGPCLSWPNGCPPLLLSTC